MDSSGFKTVQHRPGIVPRASLFDAWRFSLLSLLKRNIKAVFCRMDHYILCNIRIFTNISLYDILIVVCSLSIWVTLVMPKCTTSVYMWSSWRMSTKKITSECVHESHGTELAWLWGKARERHWVESVTRTGLHQGYPGLPGPDSPLP